MLYRILGLLLLGLPTVAAPTLRYTVSMDEPQTHYFEVLLEINDLDQATLDLTMPVWTPGSYLVREFARNVENMHAAAGNQKLPVEKIDKNTWRIETEGIGRLQVGYRVYAYELTVRTSFLNTEHGYLNGTSVFVYPEGLQEQPLTLVVKPYEEWKRISTGLSHPDKLKPGQTSYTFEVPNYDILVDSPIEIGNHEVFTFEAAGLTHAVAMQGPAQYDADRLGQDMARVVEAATAVFGENPCEHYTFIVHHFPGGGGGLEHLNSTSLQADPLTYQSEGRYRGFLSLVAHEYFHLWNVKRLRPAALGPFDYNTENYTQLLWVAEGVTSYYDDYLLRRAGITSPDQYLSVVSSNINNVEARPGNKVQSVAEASFDAWIKYYRQDENSVNALVSYYTKGAVVATMLDLQIRHATKGRKNFDDVMRYLYQEYYQKEQRGFTDAEMQQAVEKVAGRSFDEFFRRQIYGTAPIDYDQYLGHVGLTAQRVESADEPYLGATFTEREGRLYVRSVYRDTPAERGGLSADDEVLAVGGLRVSDGVEPLLAGYRLGEEVTFTVSRFGQLREVMVTLDKDQRPRYRLAQRPNPGEAARKRFREWLSL